MENWKYTAFISYRHGGNDEFVAKTLHTMLENYRVPSNLASKIGKKRVGRIFRDVDELPSSSSLYNNIEEALGQSEYFIVICTPRLSQSQWCMREIELFQKLRGSDHIIAVLAEGEPQDSFPYAITHRTIDGKEVEVEPLAADVRGDSPAMQKRKMKVEKLRILAAMLHCEFDQLRQRERQRRLRRGIAVGGVSFAVVCAFLGLTVHENMKLQSQVKKTQSAQSYLLSEYSDTAFSADNPKLAAMLAMEGLPEELGNDRPFEGSAMASLTNALQIYSYQQGYAARNSVGTQTMDALKVSPYDDYIAYVDLASSTDYTVHFYDIKEDKTVADFPVDPDYCGHQSCNSKVVFFGDHRCAIAGKEGIQILDMNNFEVLWEGVHGMTVSVNAEETVISAFDAETKTLTFYTTDGELISEHTFDCDDGMYYGMSDDGKYAAFSEFYEETDEMNPLYILDVQTGEIVKQLDDKKYVDGVYNDTSWTGHQLVFIEDNNHYGCLDMDEDKVYTTKTVITSDICHADSTRGVIYYRDGSELICASIKTGETLKTYKSSDTIADAECTGDGEKLTFAVCTGDGTIEYVDYTDEPHKIGSLAGDGTSCSEIRTGNKVIATYLLNAYEFRVYELNDRSTSKTGTMKKSSNESLDYVIRRENMLMVNGSSNSYAVNLSTLKGAEFDQKVSYMSTVTTSLVSCDELDGTISVYDAETGEKITELPDGTADNLEFNGAFMVENGLLKEYSYDKSEKSADELEPVYTEEVPENCEMAFLSADGYLIEELEEEDGISTLQVLDPDRKEILSQRVSDFRAEADRNYVLYQPEGETEYVMFNYVTGKEITRIDVGSLSWMGITSGYAMLCSSDKGAFILDDTTGEVMMTISRADTLYDFNAPEGQPYFAALFLSDNGETRLDIYRKDAPASPVARIKGGLGMNADGEVVIFDGVQTLYAVPFLSMEEAYEKGKEYLDGESLTEAQKIAYHCEE